ncbi:hypothetical protein C8F04DRAFT_1197755 [Mycena alexandri]|uniref:F-box domain-containing protein n=1 Tax=Mycena alexandri TaxID=1745969 RepID=A0AAD6S3S9_9AGAR|nr:hypothetical protein C8F04DRAFT_1197755 [Mycena alexandri]
MRPRSLFVENCLCRIPAHTVLCGSSWCCLTSSIGLVLERRIRHLSLKELFAQCLSSEQDYRVISSFLQRQPGDYFDSSSGPRTGAFKFIPTELVEIIVSFLPMVARLWFGATNRFYRAVVRRALLTAAGRSLGPYNLSLSCTSAFVTGEVLKAILFYGEAGVLPPSSLHRPGTPCIPTLDVYCGLWEGSDVATFLSHATGFSVSPLLHDVDLTGAVQDAYVLLNAGVPVIRVLETYSDNPLDAVLHFPTSADIVAWMLDCFWVAYPRAIFRGKSLTTPERLPLYNLETRQRAWDVLHQPSNLGIHLDIQRSDDHVCGESYNCPLTWRTSEDGGCLVLRFSHLPYKAAETGYLWHTDQVVSWSLGALTLCGVNRAGAGRSYRWHEHRSWAVEISALLDSPRPV